MANFSNPFGNIEPHLEMGVDHHILGWPEQGIIAEHACGVDITPKNEDINIQVHAIQSGTIIDGSKIMTWNGGVTSYWNGGPGQYMPSGTNWAGPNGVAIRRDDGHTYMYAHLSSNNVLIGQHVTSGQVIGRMGTLGISSAAHLHIQIGPNFSYTPEDKNIAKDLEQKIINNGPWQSATTTHPTNPTNQAQHDSRPCQLNYNTDRQIKAMYNVHTYSDNTCTNQNAEIVHVNEIVWAIQDTTTSNWLIYTNNLINFNMPVFVKNQSMYEGDFAHLQ